MDERRREVDVEYGVEEDEVDGETGDDQCPVHGVAGDPCVYLYRDAAEKSVPRRK